MPADVCPYTLRRCRTPVECADRHCVYDQLCKPIAESRLSQSEQYALAMDEKRKADAQ